MDVDLTCGLHNDFLLFLDVFRHRLIYLGDQSREELNVKSILFLLVRYRLALPFRVRELFFVRCPRNGKPLR